MASAIGTVQILEEHMSNKNGHSTQGGVGSFKVKTGLAQMLKGGVIMDVVTPEQAIIAEQAGAVAVMALELSLIHI